MILYPGSNHGRYLYPQGTTHTLHTIGVWFKGQLHWQWTVPTPELFPGMPVKIYNIL